MLDIGWSELLLIAIVAILVVGPKELPAMLRSFGRVIGKLRRTADEFRKHFDDAVRDVGGEELQREMKSLKQNNPLNQIRSSIEDAAREPLETSKAPENANSGQTDNEDYDDLGPPPPPLPPKNAPALQDASAGAQIAESPTVAEANSETDEGKEAPRINGAHGTAGQGL